MPSPVASLLMSYRRAEPQLVRLMWLYLAMKVSLIAVGLLEIGRAHV